MSGVVFEPQARLALLRGIRKIVDAVATTLGPTARHVAISSSFPGESPELLDKASLIARRIVQLPDPDEDMGAMLVRHLLWRLHKQVGDSTATAAVLFGAIYEGGVRYLAAGGDAMAFRRALENGAGIISSELQRQTVRARQASRIAGAAKSLLHDDPSLAALIADIFTVIDAYGHVEIRTGYERESRWDYVDGVYWKTSQLAHELVKGRTEFQNPALLVTDLAFDDVYQAAHVLEIVVRSGKRALIILAESMSAEVGAFLLANQQAGLQIAAVKTPDQFKDRQGFMEDFTTLVGGQALIAGAGDTLRNAKLAHFGGARSAWVDRDYLGILNGNGDSSARRKQVAWLQAAVDRVDDSEGRERLLHRVGKLMGGSALLWVGGVTEREIKVRKAAAELAVAAMRGVLHDGILPGAGMSLIACRPILEGALAGYSDSDTRGAFRLLITALEQPARTILQNAGYEPSEILARANSAAGCGYDVINRRYVSLIDAGIVESAGSYQRAVETAIKAAANALTIEALVHTRKPDTVLDPG